MALAGKQGMMLGGRTERSIASISICWLKTFSLTKVHSGSRESYVAG